MNVKIIILAGFVLLPALASCTSGDGEEDRSRDAHADKPEQTDAGAAGDLEIVRGHYVFGHEVRTLRPCGEDNALWVVDQTNLLQGLHEELTRGAAPYAEVFVVASGRIAPPPEEGFGADYSAALTVEDLFYLAGEGFGCDFDWSRFVYRAQGNEPFWTLEVLPEQMRLIRPDGPELIWTEITRRQVEGTVIFRGTHGEHPPVELAVETGSSRDTMSGAYYGLSARLVLGDQTFVGHALPGVNPEE